VGYSAGLGRRYLAALEWTRAHGFRSADRA
jgi:hypothetical protein